MPSFDQDTAQRLQQAVQSGIDPKTALYAATHYQHQKNIDNLDKLDTGFKDDQKGNILTSKDSLLNLPTLGGGGGALAGAAGGAAIGSVVPGIGTAIGGLIGGVVGGFSGGAGGEAAREHFNNENTDSGEILKQGAIGGLSDLGGEALGAGVKFVGKGAGKLLTKEGESLAIKGLGTSDQALFNFAGKHGEDAAQVLSKHGLAGAGAEDIAAKTDALQGEFNNLINNSGITVDKSTLRQNMLSKVRPLLESTDPGDHSIAESLLNNFDNIDTKLGEEPTLSDINKLRQEYDSKVNYKLIQQDPQQFGPKKLVADTLRDTVHGAADAAGAETSAGTLKQSGKELSKLYDLQQIAERGAYKGATKAPLGLANILGGLAGAAGGPGGAVIGAVAPNIINNPKTLSILSKLTSAAGKVVPAVTSAAGNLVAGSTGSVTANAVGNLATQDVGHLIGQSADTPNPQAGTVNGATLQPSGAVPPGSTGGGAAAPGMSIQSAIAGSNGSTPGSTPGATPAGTQPKPLISRQEVQLYSLADPAHAALYQQIYDIGNPKVSPVIQQTVIGAKNADSLVDHLQELYNTAYGGRSNSIAGKAAGTIKGTIGDLTGNTDISNFESFKDTLLPSLNSAVTGLTRFNDEEVKKIEKSIPTRSDTPAQAAGKIANIRYIIASKLKSVQNAPISYGDTAAIDPNQ